MDVILCCLVKQVGEWTIRIDSAHGNVPNAQKHVHIQKKGVQGVYSWNEDGSRHDKMSFPKAEACIKKAKGLAAEALGIDANILTLVVCEPGGIHVNIRSELPRRTVMPYLFDSYIPESLALVAFVCERGLVLVTVEQVDEAIA